MDSLGKIVDFFVMLAVLFVFPINWAFDQADTVGDYAVYGIVEDFFSEAQYKGCIDRTELKGLESRLSGLFGYYDIYISVKRGISDIEKTGSDTGIISFESLIGMSVVDSEIESKGFFELQKNDVLSVSISDKKGIFISKMRVIT